MNRGRPPSPATRPLRAVLVELDPRRLLAGWQPERAALFVAALSDARVGEDAAVTVALAGTAVRATVLGRIVAVRRMGRPALPPGVEIAVDAQSVRAVDFLCRAARGEPLPYQERSPRFVIPFRLSIQRGDAVQECVTQDVSDAGCCVLWEGAPPALHEVLGIRVREALFARTVRATVCWTSRQSATGATRIGLRVAARGRAARAWSAIVDEAGRTGIPT